MNEYEEGTFLIDIIDAASQQLVWRGAYVKRLGWSAPDEAEVQKMVSSILAAFPPGRSESHGYRSTVDKKTFF